MSRNFGLGSRDMSKAAAFATRDAAQRGEMSYSHAAETSRNFADFAEFSKQNGAKIMEYVTREHVVRYTEALKERGVSPAQQQNAVSAINTVMKLASTRWQSVSATRDCNVEKRTAIRQTAPTGLYRASFERAISTLDARAAVVASLARDLGLRTKEASLFDAKSALREYEKTGKVSVSEGTKGGRPRQIPIQKTKQLQTLIRAAEMQGNAKAVMPAGQNWKNWRENGLRNIRESLQKKGITRLHDLRSAYACQRYRELTNGHEAPVCGGKAPRDIDRAARQQIAQELGHGRIAITNSYLGKS